jgi:hypothetical protein
MRPCVLAVRNAPAVPLALDERLRVSDLEGIAASHLTLVSQCRRRFAHFLNVARTQQMAEQGANQTSEANNIYSRYPPSAAVW